MATKEISAKAAVDLSVRLLNKEKTGMPKIRDLNKEYVLDWTYFSEYAGHMHNVPKMSASLIIRFMPITKRSFIYWGHCLS